MAAADQSRDPPRVRRVGRLLAAFGRVDNVPEGSGTLQACATPGSRVATYPGLNGTERHLVVEGQSYALRWLSTNAAGDGFGLTILEHDEVGGPGFGGCPQTDDSSVPLQPPLP